MHVLDFALGPVWRPWVLWQSWTWMLAHPHLQSSIKLLVEIITNLEYTQRLASVWTLNTCYLVTVLPLVGHIFWRRNSFRRWLTRGLIWRKTEVKQKCLRASRYQDLNDMRGLVVKIMNNQMDLSESCSWKIIFLNKEIMIYSHASTQMDLIFEREHFWSQLFQSAFTVILDHQNIPSGFM